MAEKFRVGKGMIILAGPTTGKTEITRAYPSTFVDQDVMFRNIDASYFRTKKDLQKRDPAELERYLVLNDNKFVKEALSHLRDGKTLLLSRISKDMIPKFFAFIPNGKVHLMVWRDNPQEVHKLLNADSEDKQAVSFQEVDKWYKDARSSQIAAHVIWLKNGQTLEDVLDIPGAKKDDLEKAANTKLVKDIEEAQREAQIENSKIDEEATTDGNT